MTTTRRATRWSSALLLVLLAAACGAKEAVQSDGSELATGGGSSASDSSALAGSDETTPAGSGAPSSVADGASTPTATGSVDPSSSLVGNSGGSGSKGSSGGNNAGSGGNNGGSGGNNSGSPPPASPTTQTISFAPIAGGWVFGETRTLSARASSGLPVSISASGACQATNAALGLVQAVDVGECRVTASQPGGTGVQPAAPVTQSTQIGKATPTIQFSDQRFEFDRSGAPIPLRASSSSGATPLFRVVADDPDSPLCEVQGSQLLLNTPNTRPASCAIEAYVEATGQLEGAAKSATFTVDPTVVKFTDHSGATVSGDGASVSASVSLNRIWGITYDTDCDGGGGSELGGADHYTVTVSIPATRPVSCTINVYTAIPDGAVTSDNLAIPVSLP